MFEETDGIEMLYPRALFWYISEYYKIYAI